jgi:hypothetical protein
MVFRGRVPWNGHCNFKLVIRQSAKLLVVIPDDGWLSGRWVIIEAKAEGRLALYTLKFQGIGSTVDDEGDRPTPRA